MYPSAALSPPPPLHQHQQHLLVADQRVSAYDNLSGSAGSAGSAGSVDMMDDDSSDDGTVTEFSEPWDSTRWDQLLSSPSSNRRKRRSCASTAQAAVPADGQSRPMDTFKTAGSSDAGIGTLSDFETLHRPPASAERPPGSRRPHIQLLRTRSFKDRMDPLMASPRLLALRSTCNSQAGKNLQVLALHFYQNTYLTI